MKLPDGRSVISVIPERCKVCYTCVRKCPARAIRIVHGQAEVIPERCIGCGNCVKVCSQNAKIAIPAVTEVEHLLSQSTPVVAIVAPSFPAYFHDIGYPEFVGSLHSAGFSHVHEVAFGADLVAHEYERILGGENTTPCISTSCPGIVAFVEKYYPEQVENLIPVASPMIAMGKVARRIHGDIKVVFIGPCVAKKGEKLRSDLRDVIDEVITFRELDELFEHKNIVPEECDRREFDPPHAGKGGLFPISRGSLQAAGIEEDLISQNVISATGRRNFMDAVKEFSSGYLNTGLLETLCCDGCIMGAGIENHLPLYKRRFLVSSYVKSRIRNSDTAAWGKAMKEYSGIGLSAAFKKNDQRIDHVEIEKVDEILKRLGKFDEDDELNCGACGYQTCREHAIAILKGFAESEMCLPYTIERLKCTVCDLEKSYQELKSVKEALNQREKLASMGQLAAGIAHEVNNPLGVVLMYAHLLEEQVEGNPELAGDLTMIVEQATRCKKIVSGLLNFARQNRVIRQRFDLCALVRRCLDAAMVPHSITVNIGEEPEDPYAEIDRDQISQVIINIINNALDAMEGRGSLTIDYKDEPDTISFSISDSGPGIPDELTNRIFEPFFTTKQLGKGTGLGLPVTYGIIKMHSGSINVTSNADPRKGATGTSLTITLPRRE